MSRFTKKGPGRWPHHSKPKRVIRQSTGKGSIGEYDRLMNRYLCGYEVERPVRREER